jgi:hypothetical protein
MTDDYERTWVKPMGGRVRDGHPLLTEATLVLTVTHG